MCVHLQYGTYVRTSVLVIETSKIDIPGVRTYMYVILGIPEDINLYGESIRINPEYITTMIPSIRHTVLDVYGISKSKSQFSKN